MKETIQFRLNSRPVQVTVDSDRMLLWVLRTELGLTGTKFGCGQNQCGACTVIVDKETVRSCHFPVKQAKGKSILTIEGLAGDDKPHPLQKAFVAHHALQCGFCTPGMLLTAYSLLLRNPNPSPSEVIEGMDGNLCRCGCYGRIVEAIQAAATEMKGARAR